MSQIKTCFIRSGDGYLNLIKCNGSPVVFENPVCHFLNLCIHSNMPVFYKNRSCRVVEVTEDCVKLEESGNLFSIKITELNFIINISQE